MPLFPSWTIVLKKSLSSKIQMGKNLAVLESKENNVPLNLTIDWNNKDGLTINSQLEIQVCIRTVIKTNCKSHNQDKHWHIVQIDMVLFTLLTKYPCLSSLPAHTEPVTYTEAKTHLHSQFNEDLKKENSGYQPYLDPIWRLERALQTTIFHLPTGYCGLSACLKRNGISDSSLCDSWQTDKTLHHVLQSCSKFAKRRQLTWPHGADLVTKLWGLAEDLSGQLILW